jgi:hypothetical protein
MPLLFFYKSHSEYAMRGQALFKEANRRILEIIFFLLLHCANMKGEAICIKSIKVQNWLLLSGKNIPFFIYLAVLWLRIRIFLSLQDPGPSLFGWIRILASPSKKTLVSTVLWLQKIKSKKLKEKAVLCWHLESRAGSGSEIGSGTQWYGSKDSDPYPIVPKCHGSATLLSWVNNGRFKCLMWKIA